MQTKTAHTSGRRRAYFPKGGRLVTDTARRPNTVCGRRRTSRAAADAKTVSPLEHTMPLSLTDPRWSELQSSYGDTVDVVAWLTDAQEGGLSDERLGDLINEVKHQGETSTAMYAVATHLIALARRATPEGALRLLIHAGMIYADSDEPGAVPCPAFLQEEFDAFASEGARRLAPLLPLAVDFYT
jgi:hypothetical protein